VRIHAVLRIGKGTKGDRRERSQGKRKRTPISSKPSRLVVTETSRKGVRGGGEIAVLFCPGKKKGRSAISVGEGKIRKADGLTSSLL